MENTAKKPQESRKNFQKKRLGKYGEDLAASYLLSHGYSIIERNFQKRYGELDIVATVNNILVVIEVKTRVGHAFGLPEESVTPRKLREVVQTAYYYTMLHPEWSDRLRIDVIGIELHPDESVKYFHHIQNVTQ